MKKSFLSVISRTTRLTALSAVSAILVIGCGGGGGGGSQVTQVTPSSLDGVTVRLFGAFTIQLQKRSSNGNTESGAVTFRQIRTPFFVGDGGVVYTIEIPNDGGLRNMEYIFTKNSTNTGTLRLISEADQAYPFSPASKNNPKVRGSSMFWSLAGGQHELRLDITFSEDSGKIKPLLTARVVSFLKYKSDWINDTVGAETEVDPASFNTNDAQFTLTRGGGLLPSGYAGIVYGPNEPNLGIWTGLSNPKKNLNFKTTSKSGSPRSITRRIRHDTTTAVPRVDIDGLNRDRIRDSGVVGYDVDSDLSSEVVRNDTGAYSYATTGGSVSKLSIQLRGETIHYTMAFISNVGGSFTATNGESGMFTELLDTNTTR